MKRIFVFLSVVVVLVSLVSCSMVEPTRRITVTIPTHPWEIASGQNLWYTLKWTCGNEITSMHISAHERVISIDVPVGETVLVAAYPLGDMSPFGGAITPLDENPRLMLSQNDGALVAELMNVDRSVTHQLNYTRLREGILKSIEDFRCIDRFTVLRDLQNGELADTSIRISDVFEVPSFVIPNGIWTSEFICDASFVVWENLASPVRLPEGVFRYLNPEMDRILVLVVDSKGETYSYMRPFLP